MKRALGSRVTLLLAAVGAIVSANAAESPGAGASEGSVQHRGPACGYAGDFFQEEVWTKVAAHSCLKCHKVGGDAAGSELVLRDPARDPSAGRADSLRHNRDAFARMAAVRNGGQSRLLRKATGELGHEGEEVVKRDSAEYRILAEFVRRVTNPDAEKLALSSGAASSGAPGFFDGVVMIDDRRLLRRVTLSLGARLPTPAELASVQAGGLAALAPILDALMKDDAFYERLAEGFNDIFLTRGYGMAEDALSYEDYAETRRWTQKVDLSHITDKAERQKVINKLAGDYAEALLREPLELIKHLVRNERPFTELVTADYIMMSPASARGYGLYDELRERFNNPEDPFEFIPVRLKALKPRKGKDHQESVSGYYAHAGLLSTFQYLRRYPTTETNRNRLRARMYYEHFLGIDVLELAARVSDAAAVSAKYEVPTMQAAECVICHKTLDPVAGLFQSYYSMESRFGVYGPRKEGWFQDMFGPGLEGENLPADERWRALPWLGERTAKDPRFATTMVEHVWYILTGRKVLLPPKALDDPEYDAKLRAYQAQRQEVERIAARFAQANFNLKGVFKDWVASPLYRADSLATITAQPARRAELADVGVARMLSPEQLERKLAAIFGEAWGELGKKETALLYGGIDSREVTERAADPSGVMGAIQRSMANDVACKHVPVDFTREPAQRRLFPSMELDVLPDGTPAAEQRIRAAIVHLHELVLGRYDAIGDPEVTATYELFAGIIGDAQSRKDLDPLEAYSCRGLDEQRLKDPAFTLRAWRGVVTYLLRQHSFLYE
jgi:hypothetical protein